MSATGSDPCRSAGLTLIELMVVLAIVGLATAAASLAWRDPSAAEVAQEAQRLAALLETARAHSRASGLPVRWQPSDATPQSLPTIAARTQAAGLGNVLPPCRLDVLAEPWFPADTPAFDVTVDATFDAIYCANMLHIAPWATCDALMRLAARHLSPTGQLITYGPYLEDEVPTAPGNLAFDVSLRAQDPAWGIRRREDVAQVAERAGLRLAQRHAMPANNLLLVWQRVP